LFASRPTNNSGRGRLGKVSLAPPYFMDISQPATNPEGLIAQLFGMFFCE
jgi:hypothetical protein